MAKLNINLLPPELEAEKKQKSKFSNTLKLSIIFLVAVIGVATVVLSLRLSQNVILSNVNNDFEKAKTTLSSPEYNQREGLALTLRDRLESISGLLGQETYGSYAFNLISDLVPPQISLTNFSIDSKGIIGFSIETNDLQALETFLNRIIDPASNQDKVELVEIGGINRGTTDVYRTDLVINLVGSGKKEE